MKRIRPLRAATALVIVSGIAVLPTLTSVTPASAATVSCAGTSLADAAAGGIVRIPTITNAHPAQWQCNLGPGNSGTAVARLQIDLNNCFHDNLTVDGDYGTNTENAVKAVQRWEGVPADGFYGPQTIRRTIPAGGQLGQGRGFLYQESGAVAGACDNLAAVFG